MLNDLLEEWDSRQPSLSADAMLMIRLIRRWIHYGALALAVSGSVVAAVRNTLGL